MTKDLSKFLPEVLLFFLLPHTIAAQELQTVGSKAHAMGSTSAVVSDVSAIFNNPAGSANLRYAAFTLSYDNVYGFADIYNLAAGYHLSTSFGNFGIGLLRFGDELLSKQRVQFTYSHSVGNAGLGVSISYLQYWVKNVDSRGVPTFKVGSIVRLSKYFSIGTYITNITQSALGEKESLPTVLHIGIAYQLHKYGNLHIEVEKGIQQAVVYKFGIEYILAKKVAIRIGFLAPIRRISFGLGIVQKSFSFSYHAFYHEVVGISHGFSISYIFKRKNN